MFHRSHTVPDCDRRTDGHFDEWAEMQLHNLLIYLALATAVEACVVDAHVCSCDICYHSNTMGNGYCSYCHKTFMANQQRYWHHDMSGSTLQQNVGQASPCLTPLVMIRIISTI